MARSNVIVGAGIWGCTIARILAERGEQVNIIEERSAIGGNCSSHFDDSTGIEIHDYGSHIFHTDNTDVWSFVNRFASFNSYRHRVFAIHNNRTYQLPLGLALVNKFFDVELTPYTVDDYLTDDRMKKIEAAFFTPYSSKQWGKYSDIVGHDAVKRLPVRKNLDTSYFNDAFQGLPMCGYCEMFNRIVDHRNIRVTTNSRIGYDDLKSLRSSRIFFSGAVDRLFDYSLGMLYWRSLAFETKTIDAKDHQGCAVMNNPDINCDITRTHEFKHYHPENDALMGIDKTVIMIERPVEWDRSRDPYYPVNCNESGVLYGKYIARIRTEFPNVVLGGRLGCYRYFDMDDSVANALAIGRSVCL